MRKEITIKISSEKLSEEELNLIGIVMTDALEYAEYFLEDDEKEESEKYYHVVRKALKDKTCRISVNGAKNIEG